MAKRPSAMGKSKSAAKTPSADDVGLSDNLVTVSYNLPVELVDLLRRLARKRADDVRAARSRGKPVEGDARTSASKIVLDALISHIVDWRKELGE